MSVSFAELEGSPTIVIRDGQIAATRMFRVAWGDLSQFVTELWGSWTVSGGVAVFTPPAAFPGLLRCIVHDVGIEPFDPQSPLGGALANLSSGHNVYSHAKVTAGYRVVPADDDHSGKPNVPQGTILQYSSDFGAEMHAVAGRHFKWAADGQRVPPDVALGLLVPCEDIRLSWRRVPLPPWAAIRDCRGRVNATEFMGHNAETVLFLGARAQRDFQLIDTGLWRLDYHFKVKEIEQTTAPHDLVGWNHAHREGNDEQWQRVVQQDDSSPYATTDFDGLFEFE